MALIEILQPLNLLSWLRICAGPIDRCLVLHSRIAATSWLLKPCAGSAGAYGDLVESLVDALRPSLLARPSSSLIASVATMDVVPFFSAALRQLRIDTSDVPIFLATSTTFMPLCTNVNASVRCCSVNLPLQGFFFAFLLLAIDASQLAIRQPLWTSAGPSAQAVSCRFSGSVLGRTFGTKTLIPFLEKKQYKGKPLIELLGGWMKAAQPLRGKKIVAYHKNISYFSQLFGFEIVDYLEPKPGIPPTPGHIASVMDKMRAQKIRVMWAENYFDIAQVRKVAEKVNAVPVIVALAPGGQPGMKTFFDMFDIWIRELNRAFEQAEHTSA
jgi:hypothetical protein